MPKRFKFRLQRLLDFRVTLRKEQERVLAERNARLRDEEQILADAEDAHRELDQAPKRPQTIAELEARTSYGAFLGTLIEAQEKVVEVAAVAADEAREEYIQKAIDAKVLGTLREKKREQYREQRKRQEKKMLDDLTVQRFGPDRDRED